MLLIKCQSQNPNYVFEFSIYVKHLSLNIIFDSIILELISELIIILAVEGILVGLQGLVAASSMAVLPLELKVGLPYLRRYP